MTSPPIVDAHNDLLIELVFRERRGESGPFAAHWLPALRSGGVALQVCPVFVDLPHLPERGLREALDQIGAFGRAIRENDHAVVAVRTLRDLDVVERGERTALMLSCEGAEPLGYDPRLVEVMWELGVRMLSLTWNRRNPFADGAAETGGGGLSELGRKLVDLCVELGVVVDLAHTSEASYREVLERTGDAPVVVSHAACRAIYDHPRNLADDALRALADRGGVLGVMLHPLAVDLSRPTLDRVVDHIDHAVEVMGIVHVGFGSDFTQQVVRALGWQPPPDSLLTEGLPPDAAIEGLAGPADFPNLVEALRHRGYDDAQLAAVAGGNFLRLFERVLPERS